MSTELTELIRAQTTAVADAYRTAYDAGYARAVAERTELVSALKALLRDVEEFGFDGISIEHPLAVGVALARAVLEKEPS